MDIQETERRVAVPTVFVIEERYPYEGGEIKMVFNNWESAHKYVESKKSDRRHGPNYAIHEMEVRD